MTTLPLSGRRLAWPLSARTPLFAGLACFSSFLALPLHAQTILTAESSDNNVNPNGSGQWTGDAEARIGKRNTDGTNYVFVAPFELPDLQGDVVQSATLTLHFNGGSWGAASLPDLDLYGSTLVSTNNSVADPDFYVDGANPANPYAQLLQDQFVDTDVLVNGGYGSVDSADIGAFIQSLYNAGAQPGEHVFLIVTMDAIPGGDYKYIKAETANSTNQPTLTLETGPASVTETLMANTSDNVIRPDGTSGIYVGQAEARIGRPNNDGSHYAYVMPFQLPDLGGAAVSNAELTLNFFGGSYGAAGLGNVDLYGSTLHSASSSVANSSYHVDASNPSNPDAVLLQDDFAITADLVNGGYGDVVSADLSSFIQARYNAGAQPGDYIFLIAGLDQNPGGDYKYIKASTANTASKPQLVITAGGVAPPPPTVTNETVTADGNDTVINVNGSAGYTGQNPERLGRGGNNGYNYCMVLPFRLPDLMGGEVTGATLSVNITGGSYGAPSGMGNIDLYGHSASDTFGDVRDPKFYVDGENPSNPDATLLMADFASEADLTNNGWGVRTSVDLSSYIQDFYDNNTPAGSFVYLILTLDQIPGSDYKYLNVESANGSIKPVLDLEITGANEIGKAWGTTDRISQYGVTWTFDQEYEYGTYVTGDFWVKGPITITNIENHLNDSNYTPRAGQNGSMINPLAGHSSSVQGYDDARGYDSSLNVALPGGNPVSSSNPLVVPVDSSLVSAVSWLYNSSSDREPGCPTIQDGGPRPMLRSAAILTVVDNAPADYSFRPPYAGSDKSLDYQFGDLDLSKLSNLTPPGSGLPSLPALEAAMARPWIDHRSSYYGRYYHPSENMPDYGRDMAHVVNNTALMTNLDFTQLTGNPSKDKLIINLVQYGIDCTGVADNGPGWVADGGHMLGRKLPIVYAGLLLDDAHMLDVGNWGRNDSTGSGTGVAFQEFQTHFYVSQAEIDITQSGLKSNGGQWDPDSRDIAEGDIIPYDSNYLGTPEWGIRHSYAPTRDNADLPIYYRAINGSVNVGTALAMQIMGAKSTWNNDVFFDYADRYWIWTNGGGTSANQPTGLTKALWPLYRDDYAPVWSGDPDPSN